MLTVMNNQTPWEGEHGKSVTSNRKSSGTLPAVLHCDGMELERFTALPLTSHFPVSYNSTNNK